MSERQAPENAVIESYRAAFAPFIAVQQEALKAAGRLAHFQQSLFGDYIDLSLAHATGLLAAKSGPEAVSLQTEFGARFSNQMQKRSQEWLKIVTESQSAVTDSAVKAADSIKADIIKKAA